MELLKCKMCGGDLEVDAQQVYATCTYCGLTMTIPKPADQRMANLFNRATHFRMVSDFDKALIAYENILNEDDRNAEAHWGVVLCRFGIEYIEDPISHEIIPTCHRVQFNSILKDPDYLASLEYAPTNEVKNVYRKEAMAISEIQKDILAISQKEKPYDIFICYKETYGDGTRTKDSVLAQDIYYHLVQEGFNVFFSRLTLEDKLGTEYEPFIFAALNSAKVMIVLGTNPEHFNAVWVRNEWSRYLELVGKDRKKLLLPCYLGMNPYDLPEELSMFQSQDMSKIGYIQDLMRGIKKVLHEDSAVDEKEDSSQEISIHKNSLEKIARLLEGAKTSIEHGEFKNADEYLEQALDIDQNCAYAYFYKIYIQYRASNDQELFEFSGLRDFSDTPNYVKALSLADEEEKKKLIAIKSSYIWAIEQKEREAKELVEKQESKNLFGCITTIVVILFIIAAINSCFNSW